MPAVDIDGLKVDYEDQGTGLPVVFIPGLTGSKDWFKYQFSGLSEHYRIISYNLRLASRREAYTIELLTEDLARFMSALKLHSAVVAGHSFGGLIAQQFALTYPQRTTALILSSTFPRLPEMDAHQIIELLAPGPIEFESRAARFFSRLFGRRRPASDEVEGLAWLVKQTAGLNRETLDNRISIVQRFNLTEMLPEVSAPALLVVGAEDHAPVLAGTQLLHEGITETNLEVIEGGDHFVLYTRHDLYNAVLDDFLTSHLASLS